MRNNRSKMILIILIGIIIVAAVFSIFWRPILFYITNLVSKPYDKDFYEENFVVEDNQIYRLDNDGAQYPIMEHFSEGFENADSLQDLVGIDRGWTQLTLLSPEASTITDINSLAEQILHAEGDFLDNRVEPSSEKAQSGQQSLRTLAVPQENGRCCSKASLHTLLLHFTEGDHVWISAWYYVEEAGDFITMMDLESTFVRGWPGMRIRLHKGYLEFEFAKWEPNVVYRQPVGQEILFPMRQWVHVEAHLYLSEGDGGVIQLWQDGMLVIDQQGQTLPFAEAVYDSLEIGLSAYSNGTKNAVLYIDALEIFAEILD